MKQQQDKGVTPPGVIEFKDTINNETVRLPGFGRFQKYDDWMPLHYGRNDKIIQKIEVDGVQWSVGDLVVYDLSNEGVITEFKYNSEWWAKSGEWNRVDEIFKKQSPTPIPLNYLTPATNKVEPATTIEDLQQQINYLVMRVQELEPPIVKDEVEGRVYPDKTNVEFWKGFDAGKSNAIEVHKMEKVLDEIDNDAGIIAEAKLDGAIVHWWTGFHYRPEIEPLTMSIQELIKDFVEFTSKNQPPRSFNNTTEDI